MTNTGPLTELLRSTNIITGEEIKHYWIEDELRPLPYGLIIKIPRGEEIEDDSRESKT